MTKILPYTIFIPVIIPQHPGYKQFHHIILYVPYVNSLASSIFITRDVITHCYSSHDHGIRVHHMFNTRVSLSLLHTVIRHYQFFLFPFQTVLSIIRSQFNHRNTSYYILFKTLLRYYFCVIVWINKDQIKYVTNNTFWRFFLLPQHALSIGYRGIGEICRIFISSL